MFLRKKSPVLFTLIFIMFISISPVCADSQDIDAYQLDNQTDVNNEIYSSQYLQFTSPEEIDTWANKNYLDWTNNLNTQEIDAIKSYSGSGFIYMNSYLRGSSTKEEILRYPPQTLENINYLTQAINKTSIPENIIVYRGTNIEMLEENKNLKPSELIGKIIMDKGFMSTSLLRNSAFGGSLQLTIKVPKNSKGAYIGKLSYFPSEYELLLDKNQKLIILDAIINITQYYDSYSNSTIEYKKINLTCELLP